MEDDKELPMVVDSELGMPLEPGRGQEGYWDGRRDGEIVCANNIARFFLSLSHLPAIASRPQEGEIELDDEDKELLGEPQAAASSSAAGLVNNFHTSAVPNSTTQSAATPVSASRKPDVTWLRRTEYLSGDVNMSRRASIDSRSVYPLSSTLTRHNLTLEKFKCMFRSPKQGVSKAAERTKSERIGMINKTFDYATLPIDQLVHPTKPHLRAKQVYDLLPDEEVWPNRYSLMRFSDAPHEGPKGEVRTLDKDVLLYIADGGGWVMLQDRVKSEIRIGYLPTGRAP
jgi:RNA polymerase II-associated factor 1